MLNFCTIKKTFIYTNFRTFICMIRHHFEGLMQERRNSSASALELQLRLSCTNPLHWPTCWISVQLKEIFSIYTNFRTFICMIRHHFDELMQERRNSIANALELRLLCTNPSISILNHTEVLTPGRRISPLRGIPHFCYFASAGGRSDIFHNLSDWSFVVQVVFFQLVTSKWACVHPLCVIQYWWLTVHITSDAFLSLRLFTQLNTFFIR